MQKITLNSSHVSTAQYDKENSLLIVEFVSGDSYQYFDVPEFVYLQFIQAVSPGQFFADNIRYQYRYQKI